MTALRFVGGRETGLMRDSNTNGRITLTTPYNGARDLANIFTSGRFFPPGAVAVPPPEIKVPCVDKICMSTICQKGPRAPPSI